MTDCYLHDSTIFLHFKFSSYVRVLASGYTNQFSMLHIHEIVIFQNHAYIVPLVAEGAK